MASANPPDVMTTSAGASSSAMGVDTVVQPPINSAAATANTLLRFTFFSPYATANATQSSVAIRQMTYRGAEGRRSRGEKLWA